VNLGANTLTINSAGTTGNIAGIVAGTGGLINSGAGTFILTGTNTYSGSTLVSAGTLSLYAVGSLGNTSGTTVSSGAALVLSTNYSGILVNANPITLNGTGIGGTGALVMSGNSDTLNNPIVLQSSSTIGGTGTGTFTLAGAITGTNTNLTINLTNAGISLPTTTLTTSGNLAVTTSGAIVQTGVLTIPGTSSFTAGANAITLTQANNFTGAVSLSNSSTNNVSVTNSGALVIGTSSIGQNLSLIAGGSISENGVITAIGGTTTAAVTALTSDILLVHKQIILAQLR